MNKFQVRRATPDDVPQLRSLWQMEGLPAETLEKRFTEFQVVQNDRGEVLATLGLEILEGHGKLHGEAFAWFDQADTMRTLLWPRLETQARNHGLTRLWTSLEAPFWKGVGFKKVKEDTLPLLPPAFAQEGAAWLTMPLRSEAGADALDKQFALLKAMSREESDRLTERAKVVKALAMGFILVLFGGFALWVLFRTKLRRRPVR